MRPSCLDCVKKHLAQALVLACEVKKGYPDHYWLVIGHMAEAEDELLEHDEVYANKIRDERVKYMLDNQYQIPFMDMIKDLEPLAALPEDLSLNIQSEDVAIPYTKLT